MCEVECACVCKSAEATPTRSPGAALDAVSFNLHFKRFLLHTLHLLARPATTRGAAGAVVYLVMCLLLLLLL